MSVNGGSGMPRDLRPVAGLDGAPAEERLGKQDIKSVGNLVATTLTTLHLRPRAFYRA
jgi:hypothetical protein